MIRMLALGVPYRIVESRTVRTSLRTAVPPLAGGRKMKME